MSHASLTGRELPAKGRVITPADAADPSDGRRAALDASAKCQRRAVGMYPEGQEEARARAHVNCHSRATSGVKMESPVQAASSAPFVYQRRTFGRVRMVTRAVGE